MKAFAIAVVALAASVFGMPSAERVARVDALSTVNDLSDHLAGGLDDIRTNTGAINATITEYKAGHITKDEASTQVAQQFEAVNFKLSIILETILGSIGLNIDSADLGKLVKGATELFSEVLHTVKGVVAHLGLTKTLSAAVHAIVCVLGDLAKALGTILGKVLPKLLPTLINTLKDLVQKFRTGLLSGLLSPVLRDLAAILDGLAK